LKRFKSIDVDYDKNEASIVVSSFDQVELWQEVRSSGCIGMKWWTNEDVRVDSAATFEKVVLKNSLTHLDTQARRQTHGVHVARYLTRRGSYWRKRSTLEDTVPLIRSLAYTQARLLLHVPAFIGRQPAGMVLKGSRGHTTGPIESSTYCTGVEAAVKLRSRSYVLLLGVSLRCIHIQSGSFSVLKTLFLAAGFWSDSVLWHYFASHTR